MASDRVWLTGVGLVTALGPDVATCWPRLVAGERGLAPLTLFDATGQRASMVGPVTLGAGDLPGGVTAASTASAGEWSRTSRFAYLAAREAMAHAGILDLAARPRRVGVVVGGTTGGMFETETLLAELHADPERSESLRAMISQPLTATADRLGEALGPFFRARSLCSACSSGANAFVVGALWLLAGELDAVLVGGTDGLCRLTVGGFNALAATDPDTCRPFDVRRKGLNLGEGAGFAVLERASVARGRGALPLAELAGWAVGAEAHHITNPEPTGAAASRVIARALGRAGLSASQVDYVNAHGTATPLNDAMEAAALRLALGEHVERVPVSSSKGQIGHTLGAAGAVEAIASALALQHQVVLPTAGLEEPDPACRLVHVLHEGRRARVRAVLSNSFGFGGMDTVLALTEPELGPPHATGRRPVVITGAAALTARGLDDGRSSASLTVVPGGDDAPAAGGPIGTDIGALLSPARARRLDRPARLGAVVAERALAQAAEGASPIEPGACGVVLGTAFGSLDPSAAFMHRIFERGPRFASPADFPNLVPSSPVGHVSIYLGLRGATLATADLATSGESAVLQAIELVGGGEGGAIVAGAVEEASHLVERILSSLDGDSARVSPPAPPRRAPRSEGAAALVIEDREHALARSARPLAAVVASLAWTASDLPALAALSAPAAVTSALVVSPHAGEALDRLLAGSAWAGIERRHVPPSAGDHEGLGATALVAAAGLVHAGTAREVLVVGLTRGRGYAFLLAVPEGPAGR